MLVAKEALKEFIEGYREGRAEELERQTVEAEEQAQRGEKTESDPSNPLQPPSQAALKDQL
jgi:hypothetical protein